jgi:guanylate kinase
VPPSSPSSAEPGRLIVVSGPSGAGKSTIVRRVAEQTGIRVSVSATTRPPRPGERDGDAYHFVDDAEFDRLVDSGGLLEWARYGSHRYGTPRAPVIAMLDRGEDVLLEIEVQGARQVRRRHPDALLVFVTPPNRGVLEQRLRDRGDTDEADVGRRLRIALDEMAQAPALFDHLVVNDALDRAVAEVIDLISPGSRRVGSADLGG